MTEENAGTAEITDEREQLIADLLEEAHGLRMKYEEFSYYTETKVAEFVLARKELTAQRDDAVRRMELAQQDLQVLRIRQDQLHRELIKTTKQRDRARERVKALEASRAVRIAARLRKLLRR
jgi:hypothetical protein